MMLTAMCWSSPLTVAFTPTITMLGAQHNISSLHLDLNQSQTKVVDSTRKSILLMLPGSYLVRMPEETLKSSMTST